MNIEWINIKEKLPGKNGDYLICHKWPGHGGIRYYKVMNFQHTSYDTPIMEWYDKHVSRHITHWATINEPT